MQENLAIFIYVFRKYLNKKMNIKKYNNAESPFDFAYQISDINTQ